MAFGTKVTVSLTPRDTRRFPGGDDGVSLPKELPSFSRVYSIWTQCLIRLTDEGERSSLTRELRKEAENEVGCVLY